MQLSKKRIIAGVLAFPILLLISPILIFLPIFIIVIIFMIALEGSVELMYYCIFGEFMSETEPEDEFFKFVLSTSCILISISLIIIGVSCYVKFYY